MHNNTRGFTLVELLLVVVVMVILAAIVVGFWINVPTWSRDQARQSDTKQWISTFSSYKSRYVVWPTMPVSVATPKTVCLGSFANFNNKCGQFNSSTGGKFFPASGADHTTLLSAVDKIGDIPSNSAPANHDALAGPILYVTRNSNVAPITVTGRFINFYEGNCPSDSDGEYTTGNLPTSIALVLSGLPAGTNAHACYMQEQFTYSPS